MSEVASLCVQPVISCIHRPPLPQERETDGRHRLLAEKLATTKRKLRRAQRSAREAAGAEVLARNALEVEALKDGAGAQAVEAAAAVARRGGDDSWLDDSNVGLAAGGGGVRRRWSSVLQDRVKDHDERYFRMCTLRATCSSMVKRRALSAPELGSCASEKPSAHGSSGRLGTPRGRGLATRRPATTSAAQANRRRLAAFWPLSSRVIDDTFRGVSRPELKRMVATFRAFDLNDNGSLDPHEFHSFLEERDMHPNQACTCTACCARRTPHTHTHRACTAPAP